MYRTKTEQADRHTAASVLSHLRAVLDSYPDAPGANNPAHIVQRAKGIAQARSVEELLAGNLATARTYARASVLLGTLYDQAKVERDARWERESFATRYPVSAAHEARQDQRWTRTSSPRTPRSTCGTSPSTP